jgi:hypothetical protein
MPAEEAQHEKATDYPFQASLTLCGIREGRAMRVDSVMGCRWGLRSELQVLPICEDVDS